MKRGTKPYGKELILDLHDCDPTTFTRHHLALFFKQLCRRINMRRAKVVWWDDYRLPEAQRQTKPHLKGTSAVQFILTSNITIHTLDLLGNVYLNIFSCKNFNSRAAADFSKNFFNGRIVKSTTITRL